MIPGQPSFLRHALLSAWINFNKNSHIGLNRRIGLLSIIFPCISNAQGDLK